MRSAIFGDIHANLEAFEVVLADAREQGCESFICLGDVVGYNANPRECLEIVQSLECPVVKGNHDSYVSSEHSLVTFNPLAEVAIQWTRDQLNSSEKRWLSNLPLIVEIRGFTVVHASLDEPGDWNYVLNQLDAAASLSKQTTELCFSGTRIHHEPILKTVRLSGSHSSRSFPNEVRNTSLILAASANRETATGGRRMSCSTKRDGQSICAGYGTI